MHARIILLAFGLLSVTQAVGQDGAPTIRWLNFEQLQVALLADPRPVFIDFYADWCSACHRMDRQAYCDPRVIRLLNNAYYAVKMDIESPDTIEFGGQTFLNERINQVNPVHQIPLLMASRQDKPFSLPAMILLDENFVATDRYFQYLSAPQLVEILDR